MRYKLVYSSWKQGHQYPIDEFFHLTKGHNSGTIKGIIELDLGIVVKFPNRIWTLF
jgi:hypothetical protein